MLTVLDLFSGIGGFSLGLERTGGFRTIAFCEFDKYASTVLRARWPSVPVFGDIRELGASAIRQAGVGPVDVVCGGFPCQDISVAGKGAGLAGSRSGLWHEMHRVVGEVRPRYAIIENVSALRARGLDVVLRGLAALGYDAEWHCIPAGAVGAPHRRDRVWVVAYSDRYARIARGPCDTPQGPRRGNADRGCVSADVAHTDGAGLAQREGERSYPRQKLTALARGGWWLSEPSICRVANGVPARVDRLRCLGNAVVPEIPYQIGLAILAKEAHDRS